MKNVIVGILTLVVLGLMGYIASIGGAYHGGEAGKVIKDISTFTNSDNVVAKPAEKSDREKEDEKLQALRDKAGNAGAFKVSNEYKSKCASCHGVNGSGMQNAEKLYTDLIDFKAGRKENIIMKGLLMGLSEEDLRRFADEIGGFAQKAKEQNSQ